MKKIICIFVALLVVLSSFSITPFATEQASTNADTHTFGAIRWDAWYGHTNKGWDISW